MPQHTLPESETAQAISIEDLAARKGRIKIYTPEFALDPRRGYRAMRESHGPLVPVELAPGLRATLVVDYRTAVAVNNDFEHFSADPRAWESTLTDAQRRAWDVFAMIMWRPNALRTNGKEHDRYREATSDSLAGIDQLALQRLVEAIASPAINTFCQDGSADLLSQYCFPVVCRVIATILGCTPRLADALADASAALFDGRDGADLMFDTALQALIQLKRACPGEDITSRLLQHHAGLDEEEMVHQLLLIVSAAVEVPTNLVANTVLLLVTQPERFTATLENSSPHTTDAAIEETLITSPPMANFCLTYPCQPRRVGNVWLPAHQPVVTSIAAINDSPEINNGKYLENRSHIAFGTGPHACPHSAQIITRWMTRDIIDQLLDRLPVPDLRLAVPPDRLRWRPGPLHRALTALPVQFPATDPFPID